MTDKTITPGKLTDVRGHASDGMTKLALAQSLLGHLEETCPDHQLPTLQLARREVAQVIGLLSAQVCAPLSSFR